MYVFKLVIKSFGDFVCSPFVSFSRVLLSSLPQLAIGTNHVIQLKKTKVTYNIFFLQWITSKESSNNVDKYFQNTLFQRLQALHLTLLCLILE